MSRHGHGHGGHGHGRANTHSPRSARRALGLSLLLTAGFMGLEVAVGLWSGSLALLADAGHMLGDSGALALSFVITVWADRPRDRRATYGYRRAEVIGAFANAMGLLAVAGWIVFEAVERVLAPPPVIGLGVMLTALAGLAVNLIAAWLLAASAEENVNVRAALYHVMGDALGSVAALIAGATILTTGWSLADPLASLAIAALLVFGGLRLLRESAHVLMEGTPSHLDADAIRKTILETPGVMDLHDLHIWSLTPGQPMLTVHVILSPDARGSETAGWVCQRLRGIHGILHVTVQPEDELGLVQLRLGEDG